MEHFYCFAQIHYAIILKWAYVEIILKEEEMELKKSLSGGLITHWSIRIFILDQPGVKYHRI